MNYYKRHLGDYARDAGHLTALEHGIYTLLIDWYYVNEEPIPDARAHRIARSKREEVEPVLEEFFVKDGAAWRHKRIEREIEAYRAKAAKARESASARWSQPTETGSEMESEGTATAMRTHTEGNASHKPLAISHTSSVEEVAPAPKKRFVAPSVEEVRAYCSERGLTLVNPEHFVSYYGSNGWRVGRNPMRSWHSAVAGWEAREREKPTRTHGSGAGTRERSLIDDLTDRSWATS